MRTRELDLGDREALVRALEKLIGEHERKVARLRKEVVRIQKPTTERASGNAPETGMSL